MYRMYVNGPYNVVRLEGSVGSVKKVVYLFMDYHANLYQQSECDDPNAINIDKFLLEQFDRLQTDDPDKIYDFLFEIGGSDLLQFLDYSRNNRMKYISETTKMFKKSLKFDEGLNKIQQSETIRMLGYIMLICDHLSQISTLVLVILRGTLSYKSQI